MDKIPLFPINTQKNIININKSKQEIVNNLFDEQDNSPNLVNNSDTRKSTTQTQSYPYEVIKASIPISNSFLSPKSPDDAYRISYNHSHFNRPDSNQDIVKTCNNLPEEQQTHGLITIPQSAEEIVKKNKDINFDIILSSLRDDRIENNINIEKNYEKDDQKKGKNMNINRSIYDYHINLRNEIKSEIAYGKIPSFSDKFLNYMKNLALNDVTLVQIKFNIMKIETSSIIKSNNYNEESINKTISSILDEALISTIYNN